MVYLKSYFALLELSCIKLYDCVYVLFILGCKYLLNTINITITKCCNLRTFTILHILFIIAGFAPFANVLHKNRLNRL